MNASPPDSNRRRADLRDQMEARIQQQRLRPLPSWLAGRGRRRLLALAPAVTLALGVLAATLDGSSAGVGLLLLVLAALTGAAGTVLLRRASQMLDTAPSGLLDEREVAQRNEAYRRGHRLALVVVGVLWLLAVIDGFGLAGSPTPLLSGTGWVYVTLAALLAISMLPAAALTWAWTAPLDDPLDALEDAD
ncbi:hypothetical protein ACEXQD_08930 [Herbiconiux sp. P15]|uniref:hypothetical protein n=1 Tax=Herbiconiux liukaitaii TaxID=3342799 RepID=UPI0035BB7723